MQSFTDTPSGREKSPSALKTISEAAEMLDVPQHVLRFWETKFNQIKPLKRNGGRRFYRPEDMEVLFQVKHLLYRQGYTINGAKKAFDKKTVEEIRQEFSPVALGEPVQQDNDNRKPMNKSKPAVVAASVKAANAHAAANAQSDMARDLRDMSQKIRQHLESIAVH